MGQVRLIYTSVVQGAEPSFSELAALLRHASENNARSELTGVLCYARGQFLQVLEGERSTVNRLFQTITRDTRHRNCELLSFVEITTRSFPDWSMRLVAMDPSLDAELTELSPTEAESYLRECAAQARRQAA